MTLFDTLKLKFQQHPLGAVVLIVFVGVVGLATFKGALTDLIPSDNTGLEVAALRAIDDPKTIEEFRKRWLSSFDSVPRDPAPDSAEVRKMLDAFSNKVARGFLSTPESASNVLALPGLSPDSQSTYFWLLERWSSIVDRGRPRTSYPLIDVRLRNTSQTASVLNYLEIRVHRDSVEQGFLGCFTGPMTPTAEYNVMLNSTLLRQRKFVDISHVVGGHEAERFVVAVAHSPNWKAIYELDLYLHHDNDRSTPIGTVRVRVGTTCLSVPLDAVRFLPARN